MFSELHSSYQIKKSDQLFPKVVLTLGVPVRSSQGAICKYLLSELDKWNSFWITYLLENILSVVVSLP